MADPAVQAGGSAAGPRRRTVDVSVWCHWHAGYVDEGRIRVVGLGFQVCDACVDEGALIRLRWPNHAAD